MIYTFIVLNNKMQSEMADFVSGDDIWRTRQNIRVIFDSTSSQTPNCITYRIAIWEGPRAGATGNMSNKFTISYHNLLRCILQDKH